MMRKSIYILEDKLMSIDVSRVKLPPKLRMDCYRTALYPILHYYGCDADLLLIAEGVLLQYNEKLTCAAIPFFSDEELLEDFDIDQTFLRFDRKEEVVPSLTRALDKGFFAVCLLDIYYYSLFRSVYQKTIRSTDSLSMDMTMKNEYSMRSMQIIWKALSAPLCKSRMKISQMVSSAIRNCGKCRGCRC